MRRHLTLALLLALQISSAQAAPLPRPSAGCGVLALRPAPGREPLALVLYREPGVARLAELAGSRLPRLSGDGAQSLVAVSARRGGWCRVTYDEAGREAWLEEGRGWEYLPWQAFLPGRTLRVLPALKKPLYAVRREPAEGAQQTATLGRDQAVQVLEVDADWVRVSAPAGWFRWRDVDGRLTVSLD